MLISAVSMTTVSARHWMDGVHGDSGLVRWDLYCRYVGDYIGLQRSQNYECGRVCLTNSRCTHFTDGDGNCFMYNSPNGKQVDYDWAPGWNCGYVPNRVSGQGR